MAADSVFGRPVEGGRLNPIYTLGAAVAGTLLVLAALLFAFSRQAVPPQTFPRLLLHVVQAPIALPTAAPLRRSAKPAESPSPAHTIPLPQPLAAKNLQNLPAPAASKLDLSMGLPPLTIPPLSGLEPRAFNPYSDLNRALEAPRAPATMQNGQSFRSEYGYVVVKAGGRCAALQTIQHLSLSPSVHPTVAFPIPCPGEYQPSMGDELDAWANKEKKKLDSDGSG